MCLFTNKSDCNHNECKQFPNINKLHGISKVEDDNDEILLRKRDNLSMIPQLNKNQYNCNEPLKYVNSNNGNIKTKPLRDTINTELQTMPQNCNKKYKLMTNGDQNRFNQNSNIGIPKGLQCFLPDTVLDGNNKPLQVGPNSSPYMNNNSNNVPFQNKGNHNFANR